MEKTATKNKENTKESGKYFFAIGRRKCSIARVKLFLKGKGEIMINGKKSTDYLPDYVLQEIIHAPLKLANLEKADIIVSTNGGGKTGQAEAIRLGISRALVLLDKELRKTLKVAGFLKRDPRIKERKKPGLKRARRAPQWQKR
ncbi:MAG: 30S ribosomal protein S9 [Patescibacteria group bacterium]|nr:30S ribosomal protein S9 [Patescibacteria group bacterium]